MGKDRSVAEYIASRQWFAGLVARIYKVVRTSGAVHWLTDAALRVQASERASEQEHAHTRQLSINACRCGMTASRQTHRLGFTDAGLTCRSAEPPRPRLLFPGCYSLAVSRAGVAAVHGHCCPAEAICSASAAYKSPPISFRLLYPLPGCCVGTFRRGLQYTKVLKSLSNCGFILSHLLPFYEVEGGEEAASRRHDARVQTSYGNR